MFEQALARALIGDRYRRRGIVNHSGDGNDRTRLCKPIDESPTLGTFNGFRGLRRRICVINFAQGILQYQKKNGVTTASTGIQFSTHPLDAPQRTAPIGGDQRGTRRVA